MSFTDIKTKSQGFTIVELLIVVVVIAILAAITIVSYNGITARANLSAAKATAATVQKKSELYNADSGNNRYPVASTDLTGAPTSSSYYISGVTINFSTTALTTMSNSTVRVLKCSSVAPTTNSQANIVGTGATPPTTQPNSGMRIYYYDPTTNAETTNPINVGDTTNCPTS